MGKRNTLLCGLALVSWAVACGEESFEPVDLIDSTCADILCGWQFEAGQLAASGSWHEHQRALRVSGTPAVISKHLTALPKVDCLSLDLLAHVETDAQLFLEADFNDDAKVDVSLPVPAVRFQPLVLGLRAPAEFRSVRLRLSKQGPGDVRIAKMVLRSDLASCRGAPPTTLADGSACSTDATCSSGRCALGRCARCAAEGCGEGEACRSSEECRDGACAAGICKACAKRGACVEGEGCSVAGQCASGSCITGSEPSLTRYPLEDGVCGQCASDAQCAAGFCVLGQCGGCRDDADCSAGTVCRFTDVFEASTRSCVAPVTSSVPRGGLCEADDECAGGLRCGAAGARAKRCGVACDSDDDCGGSSSCAATGFTRAVPPPASLRLLPGWSRPSERVMTCYRDANWLIGACEVQEQCAGLGKACCGGKCSDDNFDPDSHTCKGPGLL